MSTDISLLSTSEELEQKILEESDVDKLKDIIDIFNLNIKRKDIVRTARLSNLQDKIYEQMDKRFTTKADEFSNADLLNYFKTIQETINKSDTTLTSVNTPAIQIIQNHLNVSTDNSSDNELNGVNRKNITDIIQKIMYLYNNEADHIDEDIPNEYEQLCLSFEDDTPETN